MKNKWLVGHSLVLAAALLLPAGAFPNGKRHPAAESVRHAIGRLEKGSFLEAEEEMREALGATDKKGVKADLLRKALEALQNGKEAEALRLLRESLR